MDSTVGLGRSTASLSSAAVADPNAGRDSSSNGDSRGGTGSSQSHISGHDTTVALAGAKAAQRQLTIDITGTGVPAEPDADRQSAASAVAVPSAPSSGAASSHSDSSSACAVKWFWAAGTGPVAYDRNTCDKLEAAWRGFQRNEPGAHDSARQVDIGGGRHVDLVRSRQVVTAEPHRSRRVFRRIGVAGQ